MKPLDFDGRLQRVTEAVWEIKNLAMNLRNRLTDAERSLDLIAQQYALVSAGKSSEASLRKVVGHILRTRP